MAPHRSRSAPSSRGVRVVRGRASPRRYSCRTYSRSSIRQARTAGGRLTQPTRRRTRGGDAHEHEVVVAAGRVIAVAQPTFLDGAEAPVQGERGALNVWLPTLNLWYRCPPNMCARRIPMASLGLDRAQPDPLGHPQRRHKHDRQDHNHDAPGNERPAPGQSHRGASATARTPSSAAPTRCHRHVRMFVGLSLWPAAITCVRGLPERGRRGRPGHGDARLRHPLRRRLVARRPANVRTCHQTRPRRPSCRPHPASQYGRGSRGFSAASTNGPRMSPATHRG